MPHSTPRGGRQAKRCLQQQASRAASAKGYGAAPVSPWASSTHTIKLRQWPTARPQPLTFLHIAQINEYGGCAGGVLIQRIVVRAVLLRVAVCGCGKGWVVPDSISRRATALRAVTACKPGGEDGRAAAAALGQAWESRRCCCCSAGPGEQVCNQAPTAAQRGTPCCSGEPRAAQRGSCKQLQGTTGVTHSAGPVQQWGSGRAVQVSEWTLRGWPLRLTHYSDVPARLLGPSSRWAAPSQHPGKAHCLVGRQATHRARSASWQAQKHKEQTLPSESQHPVPNSPE